jgi:hypothetical protein
MMTEQDYAVFDEEGDLLDAAYQFALEGRELPKYVSDRLEVLRKCVQDIDRRERGLDKCRCGHSWEFHGGTGCSGVAVIGKKVICDCQEIHDPRAPAQIEHDEWELETLETRRSDEPR